MTMQAKSEREREAETALTSLKRAAKLAERLFSTVLKGGLERSIADICQAYHLQLPIQSKKSHRQAYSEEGGNCAKLDIDRLLTEAE